VSISSRSLDALVGEQFREQAGRLRLAALAGVGVGASMVLLLGLSAWFITGSALAGAAGLTAAHAFNVLMPSATIRFLAIVRTGSRYVERVSSHEAALKALARIRPALFMGLTAGPPARAFSISSGEASARFIQDVDALQTLFVRRSAPWTAGAGALAALSLTAMVGPPAAAVVLGGMILSGLGSAWLGRRIDPLGRRRQMAMGMFKNRLSAHQGSAAEIAAYGLQAWAITDVMRRADAHDRLKARVEVATASLALWQAGVSGLTLVGVAIAASGATLPLLAMALLAALTGLEAIAALSVAARDAGAAKEAYARIAALLPRSVAASSAHEPIVPAGLSWDGPGLVPGMRLGLQGPSGSGKTTAIERLMGLRGTSHDCPDRRARFSYAAQQVQLIDGTVRENLLIGAEDATEDDLWQALTDADLAIRIAASPGGLDTPVGQDGMQLSGGERRRLTLARAYLRAAPWLVLDEPTEGLDAETERRVSERLRQRLSRTRQGLILVSHRDTPLLLCDRVMTVAGVDVGGAVRMHDQGALLAA
jgi:ATP-binding cassette subfamily C protein CydC